MTQRDREPSSPSTFTTPASQALGHAISSADAVALSPRCPRNGSHCHCPALRDGSLPRKRGRSPSKLGDPFLHGLPIEATLSKYPQYSPSVRIPDQEAFPADPEPACWATLPDSLHPPGRGSVWAWFPHLPGERGVQNSEELALCTCQPTGLSKSLLIKTEASQGPTPCGALCQCEQMSSQPQPSIIIIIPRQGMKQARTTTALGRGKPETEVWLW